MINVNKNKFENLAVVAPTKKLLEQFHRVTSPFFDLIRNLQHRVSTLRTTRDLLLPKLISGEIPVEAADEKATELMEEIAQPA